MVERQYLIDAMTVNDTWRLFKIMAEIVDGFETLSEFHPCVSIFGSARIGPDDETYLKTVAIAKELAKRLRDWQESVLHSLQENDYR